VSLVASIGSRKDTRGVSLTKSENNDKNMPVISSNILVDWYYFTYNKQDLVGYCRFSDYTDDP
jgi:hypothetical protein